jgi:arginyl-tRNA--protein-N-Asp/Glu arginylyltransferase
MTSVVDVAGAVSGQCGYCSSASGSASFGAWAHALNVEDYAAMLDKGWRRSGQYMYRPNLANACCQAFVIRLQADRFKPTPGQIRVLKRLRRVTAPAQPTASSAKTPKPRSAKPTSFLPASVSACSKVADIVRTALADLSSDQSLALDSAVIAAAGDVSVRRRPPRMHGKPGNQEKKSRQVATPRMRPTPASRDASFMELTTNAAMVIAAGERRGKQAAEAASAAAACLSSQDPVVKEGRLSKKGKKDVGANIARQMQIATAIVSWVERHGHPGSHISSVSAASPGWINISWLRSNDDSDEEHRTEEWSLEALSTEAVADADGLNTLDTSPRQLAFPSESKSNPASAPPDGAMGSTDVEEVDRNDQGEEDTGGSSDVESFSSLEVEECEGMGGQTPSTWRRDKVDLRPTIEGRSVGMVLVPSQFEQDEYELYRRYQMAVHQSAPHECRARSYRRFLVDSPLIARGKGEQGCPPLGYGSFHIRYTLDGVLFAVGVVDVLPHCLSSVYLFFDPAYADLSPGVLSAIKEIEWVQSIIATGGGKVKGLIYYYLGFFIPTCKKMARKAAYRPSEIMCEETRVWVDAECALAQLAMAEERGKRTLRLVADEQMTPAAAAEISDCELTALIDNSSTLFGDDGTTAVLFKFVERMLSNRRSVQTALEGVRERIGGFVRLVGPEIAKDIVYVLR